MKKLLLLSLVIFLFSEIGNAQCKYKKTIPFSKKISISISKPEVIVATPLEYLYRKDNAYAYLFCKSKIDSAYLYLNIATNWEKFEINEVNPIIFKFKDQTEMKIFPNGEYVGLLSGMQAFQIGAFYNINFHQLNKLSNNTVTEIQIYFSDDEKPNAYTILNDDGLVYYKVDVDDNKKAEKIKEMANCILNFK